MLLLVQLERIVIWGDRMEGDSEKSTHLVLICISWYEIISYPENVSIKQCVTIDSDSVNSVTSTLHL